VTEKTETQPQEDEMTSKLEDSKRARPKLDAYTAQQLEHLNELYERQIYLHNFIYNLDKCIHLPRRSSVTTYEKKLDLPGYLTDYNGKREDCTDYL
jgi:hypothetical protein